MLNSTELTSIIATVIVGYDTALLVLDRPFKECGIDSLEYVNLLLAVEDKYSIVISNDEADALKTPHDLIEHVNAKIVG
jgi:acyl carrier protein